MIPADNPNWFTNNPLQRLNNEEALDDVIAEKLKDTSSLLLPLWRGDPLTANGKAAFLAIEARSEFPTDASIVMLGSKEGRAYFAIDASTSAEIAEDAPFADIGVYMPMREAAGTLPRDDVAIAGHARWLFEWQRKNKFCPNCGSATMFINGGAKSHCGQCESEHFPRTEPVAIVLAVHDGACLLGRGPTWPPGFLSALAGFIEAGETPEEAARREIFEEAGVTLTDIHYQFSQPWPFPASMMMGFFADAQDRALNLDTNEIEEARWIDKADIQRLLQGEEFDGVFLPPKFTIARQLLERWAAES